jgi:predicted AlkP superfamily phosphohydrolase/phosphomutase
MEPHYSANHLIDPILRRLERGHEAKAHLHSTNLLKTIYRSVVPRAVRRQINTLTGRNIRNAQRVIDDRRMRKYFAVPHNANAGAIRINLEGREKDGRVKPGKEYQTLCDELERDLRDIVNLDSGEPLIRDVVRLRDTCPGERAENMPDLFVIWNRSAPIFRIGSPKIGHLSQPDTPGRTGDHTPNTALLIADPAQHTQSHFSASARVEDVAPTMTSLFGVTLDDVDGKSLL